METSVWSLWLPIIVSGVALFFASWVAWMLLPHHKGEWKGLPNEDGLMNTLKGAGIPPGQYMFPYAASPEECKSEAFKAKMKAGPSGTLTVFQGSCSAGQNMVCTWLLFTVLSFIIAYLAGQVLGPGETFMKVFQFVGTAGILTYGSSGLLNAIWFHRKVGGDIADGIAYGLITGLIFAAMWPGGAA